MDFKYSGIFYERDLSVLFLFVLAFYAMPARSLFFIPPDLQQQSEVNWLISIDPKLHNQLFNRAYDHQLDYQTEKMYIPPDNRWLFRLKSFGLSEFIKYKIESIDNQGGLAQLCRRSGQPVCNKKGFLKGLSGSLKVRPELGGAYSKDERVNFINWYQYHSNLGKRLGYLLSSAYHYSEASKPDQWAVYSYDNNKVKSFESIDEFDSLRFLFNTENRRGLNSVEDSGVFIKADGVADRFNVNKTCPRFLHLHISVDASRGQNTLKAEDRAFSWMENLISEHFLIPLQPFIREYSSVSKQVESLVNDYNSSAHMQKLYLSLMPGNDIDSYSIFDDEILEYQKAIHNISYYSDSLYKKVSYLKNYGSVERFLVSEYDSRLNVSHLYEFSGCNFNDCQVKKVLLDRSPVYSAYPDKNSKRWTAFDIRQKDETFIKQWFNKNSINKLGSHINLKPLLLNLSGGINNSQPVYIVGDKAVFFVTADNAGYISLYQTEIAVESNKSKLAVLTKNQLNQAKASHLIWRFIPPASLNKIASGQRVNRELRPVLDGPIIYQRIQYAGNTRDILLVAHGRGDAAYTALDLTELLAGKNKKLKMLWQLTPETINELGYSLNKALFFQSNIKTKRNLSNWHLAIPNGYKIRSREECDLLYIIDPINGQLQKTFKSTICKKGLSPKNNNDSFILPLMSGLSGLAPLDVNQDGKADYFYAADHAARLRRFDLTAEKISQWKLSLYDEKDYLFQALNNKGFAKRTQATPAVMLKYNNKNAKNSALIAMATGRYLEKRDFYIQDHEKTTESTESIYVLIDQLNCKKNCRKEGVKHSDLYQLKAINKVNHFSWKQHQGWYFDFPKKYEKVIYQPLIINDILLLQTFVLEAKACVRQDMISYLYAFDLNLKPIKPFFQPSSELNIDSSRNNNPIRLINSVRQPMQILKCPYGLCIGLGITTIGFDDGFVQGRRRWQLLY